MSCEFTLSTVVHYCIFPEHNNINIKKHCTSQLSSWRRLKAFIELQQYQPKDGLRMLLMQIHHVVSPIIRLQVSSPPSEHSFPTPDTRDACSTILKRCGEKYSRWGCKQPTEMMRLSRSIKLMALWLCYILYHSKLYEIKSLFVCIKINMHIKEIRKIC